MALLPPCVQLIRMFQLRLSLVSFIIIHLQCMCSNIQEESPILIVNLFIASLMTYTSHYNAVCSFCKSSTLQIPFIKTSWLSAGGTHAWLSSKQSKNKHFVYPKLCCKKFSLKRHNQYVLPSGMPLNYIDQKLLSKIHLPCPTCYNTFQHDAAILSRNKKQIKY